MTGLPGHDERRVDWRFLSLERPAEETERLLRTLSPAELARGRRILDPARGEQFLVGRGLLREALSALTGGAPGQLAIEEDRSGRPRLAGAGLGGRLDFNLAHSGSYLLLATAWGGTVGVDLELVDAGIEFAPMARRYFSTREQEELFSLAEDERLEAFYRCWTRKEAYLKGCGTGFSQPTTAFDVSLLPGVEPALTAHRGSPEEVGRWTLQDLAAPEGYRAALALSTAPLSTPCS